jgi:hypothetical protein|uniref:Uncharacterized protein n=1 Tax=viral metagenome TaxID=1070528 RepID=A0A6C0LVC7_9ZZZZ
MFKIQINCTTKKDLSFNNKPIKPQIYKEIIQKLQPLNLEYIESIQILYKNERGKSFTKKTFEIFINSELSREEFKAFIHKLKDIGFYSENEKNIKFNEIINTMSFNYNFTTEEPLMINSSKYATGILYKK